MSGAQRCALHQAECRLASASGIVNYSYPSTMTPVASLQEYTSSVQVLSKAVGVWHAIEEADAGVVGAAGKDALSNTAVVSPKHVFQELEFSSPFTRNPTFLTSSPHRNVGESLVRRVRRRDPFRSINDSSTGNTLGTFSRIPLTISFHIQPTNTHLPSLLVYDCALILRVAVP